MGTKKKTAKTTTTTKRRPYRRRFRRFNPIDVTANATLRDDDGKIILEAGIVPNPDAERDDCGGRSVVAVRVNAADGSFVIRNVAPWAFIAWADALAGAWMGRGSG